ncbi:YkoF family thiamine/hydroxymethylpyrimidine-binding protein [Miniphocaeibacter halophilus]|uniref:Thiamine-binding protein n=1 Tax=Miniphocaeibacter halophilus TaxID=2931922 RepID=A0AC61MT55_9FIRM|nr:YkoF family thiamine/hydroxymethylpyrimidine-binding protein [Miniphocaeibacter halophilus]QQK08533.1 thiamine-binding protein [Miniphocaeibacter halophilus]
MCEIQEEKLISCQLSFYPLGKDKVNTEVEKVLELVVESDLDYNIGDMSTVLKGETSKIYDLLERITNITNSDFTMVITISNT